MPYPPTRLTAVYLLSTKHQVEALWGVAGAQKVLFRPRRVAIEIVVGESQLIRIRGIQVGTPHTWAGVVYDDDEALLTDAPLWALQRLYATKKLLIGGPNGSR